ncbi:MAG: sensor histidine kinase [Oscillospiraceae bacterium]|nr:sensor histidine kinase [Oscillospiraceae bacterium]
MDGKDVKRLPRLFFDYLRQYRWVWAAVALFSGIFALVFFLSNLPVQAVGYAALLCLCAGLLMTAVGFAYFLRRRKQLDDAASCIEVELRRLPPPASPIEEDYQELLRRLEAEKRRLASDADAKRRDMLDYYALWVHQIKTPIAAMRLLLQEEETAKGKMLSLELLKIEQYVEMVLGYLRLSGDSTDFVLKRQPLDKILRQAVRRYASLFVQKKIRLDYRQTAYEVLTDEKWLLFVLEQILFNALKYTPAGGSIEITAEPNKVLCIRDSGIGIAPEDLPRIFEKGFTGYNGRADKKSTGIGLYLCKQVLDKLSHGIAIESAPGRGTTVRLYLAEETVWIE